MLKRLKCWWNGGHMLEPITDEDCILYGYCCKRCRKWFRAYG